MLQVIVIAVVFGFGMIAAGKKAKPVIDICNALSDVCIAIMRGIILVAPFGVFGLRPGGRHRRSRRERAR